MEKVSSFTPLEYKCPYTSKERFGKHMPSKEIPSKDGEPPKETKKMLEDENDKQVGRIPGEPLKNIEMPRD